MGDAAAQESEKPFLAGRATVQSPQVKRQEASYYGSTDSDASDEVSEAVRKAIVDWVVPSDHVRVKVPFITKTQSIVHVRLRICYEQSSTTMTPEQAVKFRESPHSQMLVCSASDKCQRKGICVAISSGTPTGAKTH